MIPEKANGFTMVEMMIAVVIIGIILSIGVIKYNDLLRKSIEANQFGNLGAIRSALSIYYGDMEGSYPESLSALTVNRRYLQTIPDSRPPSYHAITTAVALQTAADDAGGWVYNNVASAVNYGSVWVNCTHTDTKNTSWSVY